MEILLYYLYAGVAFTRPIVIRWTNEALNNSRRTSKQMLLEAG